MYVLGLSALRHDSAAALLSSDGICAAIEESKLTRETAAGGIPRQAIQFCLQQAGIAWKDVAWVGVASRPVRSWARQTWIRLKALPVAPVSSAYYISRALGQQSHEVNFHRQIRHLPQNLVTRVVELEHHLCHAASAFFASPYERALVLTMDEEGDGWAGLAALGEGTALRPLRMTPFPHSLAWIYSQVTDVLGFRRHKDEHKTQWLSMGGTPVFLDVFLDMLRGTKDPFPRLNRRYFARGYAGRVSFSHEFYRRIGIDPASGIATDDDQKRQVAASLQEACAVIVSDAAELMRKKTGARHLCLAGGLFQNGPLVAAVEQKTSFDEVFVHPAAGNTGTALGAAQSLWHTQLGRARMAPLSTLALGPEYSNEEIKKVLHNCKAYYHWFDSTEHKLDAVIQLLRKGKIVGWYQGRTEFGPRALGNRSLLASPWAPHVRENLNDYIKHREWFRPFAIAVLEEDAPRHFEFSPSTRFMASLGRVRAESRSLLESFLLPGGHVRLHVVTRQSNALFWELLKRFGRGEQAPFLVNTSFNLFGEPLVVTPRDALRSYYSSGVDAMMIGNFLVSKDAIRLYPQEEAASEASG